MTPIRSSTGYRHEALIYDSDEELLEVAVPFLRAGVAAREHTLLRLEPRQEAMVLDAMGDRKGIATLRHTDRQSSVAALRETHAVVHELTAGGRRRLRMLGDIPRQPWPQWARYEAAVNVVLGALPAWGVCPYDTRCTPATVIDDVERTHPLRATPDLTGVDNPRFEDPLTFLNRREQQPHPLQATPPEAELVDPSPEASGAVVAGLAEKTRLDAAESEALRLAAMAVVANARRHGHPPVVVRFWCDELAVVVTVTDAGRGPGDLLRGILPDGPSIEESGSLYHVREAVADVALFTDDEGFTVRLVQRSCRQS